ncbi:hypothetical protein VTJ04DRAFT_2471 [Mycothermus thermophilus]|uniref:uncharacterized protein n=1 Tax=Humicola insolens TaxID=85995 RepID=UPI00374482F0
MATNLTNLDDEIEALQAKAASLKNQLSLHLTTLLTARSTRNLLVSPPSRPSPPTLTLPRLATTDTTTADDGHISESTKLKLLDLSDQQLAHTQASLYRACASVTAFRARDPDPNAVDSGAILGLRIDVVSRARFLRPYYVLLNRPYVSSNNAPAYARRYLRVHRHTLPPCIPVAGLAGRYLPPPPSPSKGGDGGEARQRRPVRQQDLAKFVRALRREMVRYHHRLGVVADLRKVVGLVATKKGEGEGAASAYQQLVDITPADAEAKQLTLEWADGRVGRLVMDDDGDIVKLVVLGENGRDHEAARELLGGARSVEDVVRRLAAALG